MLASGTEAEEAAEGVFEDTGDASMLWFLPLNSRNFLKPFGLYLWAYKLVLDAAAALRHEQEQGCGGKGTLQVGPSIKSIHVYPSLDIALSMRVGWAKLCKPRAKECLGKSWLIEGFEVRRKLLERPKNQVLREEPGSGMCSPMVSVAQVPFGLISTLVNRGDLRNQ